MERTSSQSPGKGMGAIWAFFSLAGVACALTVLFLGMRAVMEIGGSCAEGGPYVPSQPCPQGVPLMILAGIWGGLIFAGIYAWQTFKRGIPSFLGLFWSAMFLSLGWNFFEFGFDPPGEGGISVGWLICGVLFGLMGGLPLLAAGPGTVRSFRRGPYEPEGGRRPGVREVRSAVGKMKALRKKPGRASAAGVAGKGSSGSSGPRPDFGTSETASRNGSGSDGAGDGLVSDLERLDYLRRSGALTESEFQAAKRRILGAP